MKEIFYKEHTPTPLREFLMNQFPLLSVRAVAKGIKTRAIRVNNEKASYHTKLLAGDAVQLYLPDDLLITYNAQTAFLYARDLLDVVYEDDFLLIVNKPAGLIVDGTTIDTLLNRCKHHLYKSNPTFDTSAVRLCHRLDRGTCGLIMVAKNEAAYLAVFEEMKKHSIQKTYQCISLGVPVPSTTKLQAYLTKFADASTVRVSERPLSKNSLPIETHYHLVDSWQNLSLLEVTLVTGRTHQIRAHLAFLGHPILGDSKYGNQSINRQYKMKYQALCAATLSFQFEKLEGHPLAVLAGKQITAPIPWFVTAFQNRTL